VLGSALADDFPARLPAFRSDVDEIICFGKDVEVVFDDHHAVAGIDKTMQKIQKAADVGQMEADGGFLEQEKMMGGTTCPAAGVGMVGSDLGGGQLGDEFEALGLPSRQGWAGLAELEITKTGFSEKPAGGCQARVGCKKFSRLFGGHGQSLLDGNIPVPNGKDFRFPAQTVALLAAHVGGRKKAHLNTDGASTVTGSTSARAGVVGKVRGGKARLFGGRKIGEQGT